MKNDQPRLPFEPKYEYKQCCCRKSNYEYKYIEIACRMIGLMPSTTHNRMRVFITQGTAQKLCKGNTPSMG